jgi:hypothetical protein
MFLKIRKERIVDYFQYLSSGIRNSQKSKNESKHMSFENIVDYD